MNTTLKKLLSLNLALIMLMMLFPITSAKAEHETGAYVYINMYSNGAPSKEYRFSDNLYLDTNWPGFSCCTEHGTPVSSGRFCGWSLTPGGMPVCHAEDLPAPADGEPIPLYICWGIQRYYVASNSSLFDYTGPQWVYSAAQVGDRQLRYGGSDSGTGWRWDGWKLHLTADYEGEPIRAARSINIVAWGNAVIRGGSGSAITAGGSVILDNLPSAALTVIGGENFPAVQAEELYAMRPCSAEFLSGGSDVPAVMAGEIEADGTICIPDDEAANSALRNRVYVGQDADAAVAGSYNAEPYLRLETAKITVTFDPQGGTISGLTEGESKSEVLPYGNSMPEPPEVTSPGKMLMGWSLNSSGSYRYIQKGEKPVLSGDSCTVYAIWQDIPEKYVLLDAGDSYIDDPAFLYRPTWLLALDDGQAEVPRIHNVPVQAWSTDPGLTKSRDLVIADPALYYTEWKYDLSGVTALYPVTFTSEHNFDYYRSVHGNGFLSTAETPRIFVGGWAATPTSLLPYVSEYFGNDPEYIPVSLNTKPDGSGEFREDRDCYVIWESAPAGSYVLDASWPDHHSAKVVLPSEAERFNWNDNCGLVRSGNTFSGWSVSRDELIQELSETDAFGRYHLYPIWEKNQITLIGVDGAVYASTAVSCNLPQVGRTDLYDGYTLLGWNSAPDGSGDWYSGTVVPNADLTLYGQFENLRDAGLSYVLLKYPDHWIVLNGTLREEELSVEVTLPDDVSYWYAGENSSIDDGYLGGGTYTIPCHTCLTEYKGTRFYSEYPLRSSAAFGTIRTVSTFSSLVVYVPTTDDYDVEPGKQLAGWTTDASGTSRENFFAGAGNYYYWDFKMPGTEYYALWDDADTVYLSLKDADGTVLKEFRTAAGSPVVLPQLDKLGWRLLGWSDSSGRMYDAGSSYTVTRGETVLTAVWEERTAFEIDGQSYDLSGVEYMVNGTVADWNTYYSSTAPGWKLEQFSDNLYLYLTDYDGGAIYLPTNYAVVYFSGINTVRAAAGDSAISAKNGLAIYSDNNRVTPRDNAALTITGSAGTPAVSGKNVSFSSCAAITVNAGSGAPAVVCEWGNLSSGHVTLVGAEGCPAVKVVGEYNSVSLNTNNDCCRFFAGDTAESAVPVTKYSNERVLRSEPVPALVMLDAQGGTIFGRRIWTEQWEKNRQYSIRDAEPQRAKAVFKGWNTMPDGSGEFQSYSITPQGDTTLYAIWEVMEADQALYLDYNYNNESSYIALPKSGTVTLPKLENRNGREHIYWWVNSPSYEYFPAGISLDASLFCDGETLWAQFVDPTQHTVIYMANGGSFGGNRQTSCGSGMTLWRYSSDIVSWNTMPDGSGADYAPGETYAFSEGETLVVLYAQWKAPETYVTQSNNDRLPWTNGSHYWTNAEHSEFYESGNTYNIPAGTTLYSMPGVYENAVFFHKNANGNHDYLTGRGGRRNGETIVYLDLSDYTFTRDGYVLSGWNTKADGSGTFYAVDARIPVADTDPDGNNWTYRRDYPEHFYAVWTKAPSHVIPIPLDMRQLAQPGDRLLLALYDGSGKMLRVLTAEPDAEQLELYDTERGMTYQFILAASGSMAPRCRSEKNELS